MRLVVGRHVRDVSAYDARNLAGDVWRLAVNELSEGGGRIGEGAQFRQTRSGQEPNEMVWAKVTDSYRYGALCQGKQRREMREFTQGEQLEYFVIVKRFVLLGEPANHIFSISEPEPTKARPKRR